MNSITDLNLNLKTVFLRVDFNVPIKDGMIQDDLRIRSALPTIEYLVKNNCKVIMATHLGRPEGNGFEVKYSTKPVYERLSQLLKNVHYIDDVIGEKVRSAVEKLENSQILILENLRFYKQEKKGEEEFCKKLADLADIYVNDAFGAMHRAHSSIYGMTKFFSKDNKGMGFLVKKEIEYLRDKLNDPQRPYTFVMGGAKVGDKIDLINSMIDKADNILIGGGMMFTFLKALGKNIGRSILEKDKIDLSRAMMDRSAGKIILPTDCIVADDISQPKIIEKKDIDGINDNEIGVDIGERTINDFKKVIALSKTVVLNGPMGIFEDARYSRGTEEIIRQIGSTDCISIIGGGDSANAVKKFGDSGVFTHISTGGGASLELLSGIELPGIKALEE